MIVIFGPTGVGKSDLALELAQAINGHILNADVGQFYTPCTIGSAKPDWRNALVPHHLFDVCYKPQNFTVCQYRSAVSSLLQKLEIEQVVPCVVGGSGFYIASLFFPPREESSSSKQSERLSGVEKESYENLKDIDPERAADIHPSDTYRIARALALYRKTGKLPSMQQPVYDPLDDNATIIFLTRDRTQLYDRINKRVQQMFKAGWVDEVQQLMGSEWEQFLLQKKLIGYNDIIKAVQADALSGQALEELQVTIARKTRNYAKRQLTFWRMFKKKLQNAGSNCRIIEFNLTEFPDLKEQVKQISSIIS